MSRELLRLTESLFNKPHLVSVDYFNTAMQYLTERNDGVIELAVKDTDKKKRRELHYNPDTGVGFISIEGPLTYIEYEGLCGESGPSYQAIRDEFSQMVKAGAKVVVLDQDSPGGEAYQAFETARHIRELADQNSVKLISYVDGLSASASYVFSSVCHEVISNPQAEVGSIGVVVKLRNTSKAMKGVGVEDTYIYAGESKVPFDSEGNFTEEVLSDIQAKVDVLYKEFVSHVSSYRSLSSEDVIATKAKTFLAGDAIKLGLVDKQMTLDEFSHYLADIVQQEGGFMPVKSLFKSKEDTLEMSKEALTQVTELTAQLETIQSEFGLVKEALAQAEAAKAELAAAFAEKETSLAAALAQVTQLQDLQVEAKAQARKEKLGAVMAAERVEAVAASLAGLDDAAFAVVLEGFVVQHKQMQGSDMFVELGDQGVEQEETTTAPKADATTEILKSRLNIQ